MIRSVLLGLVLVLSLPTTSAFAQLGVDEPDPEPVPRRDRFQTTTLGDSESHTRIRVHGPPPERYQVRRGDTLWSITGRFLGNPWEWPRVWALNPEVTNPHWIYPDHELRLRGASDPEATLPTPGEAPTSSGGHDDTRPRRAPPGTIRLRQEGFLDKESMEAAGTIVGSPEDHMLLAPYDRAYVRFQGKTKPTVGRTYTIFRRVSSSERPPAEKGELVRVLGSLRLERYDEKRKVGEGLILETLDPVERGHSVAAIERRFVLVAPRRNTVERKGRIIATPRSRELNAQHQVVFVDLGEKDGLEVGNRVFVIRTGDEWRRNRPVETGQESDSDAHVEDGNYPPEVLAEGRVASVRPRNSAVIITGSLSELSVGDEVEVRKGF